MRKKQEKPNAGKRSFWETVGKRLEIDADMIFGGERVEIRGRRRCEFEERLRDVLAEIRRCGDVIQVL